MEIYGFMRSLIDLKRYMTVDESIVKIGISGISGISGKEESGRQDVKGTS
jgi:hypothetical protein